MSELELLRAECNRLAAERDLLSKRTRAFHLRHEIDTKLIDTLKKNLHIRTTELHEAHKTLRYLRGSAA